MPRDPSGNYTLPAGNPVVTGTTITSTWANTTLNDLASAMTDSLSRTGQGGLLAPFALVDGTVSLPALTFQSETNTGLYRAGAFDSRYSIGGTDIFQMTSSKLTAFVGFVGPPTNGSGIVATASGNGHGVSGFGGTGGASGIVGTAGDGTGSGARGIGVSGGLGILATSSAANVDVARIDGYIDVSHATNPTSTTGFTNRITPKNVPKAWGLLRFNGAGSVSVLDGFNIASVTLGLSDITVTFATALSSNLFGVSVLAGTGQPIAGYVQTRTTTTVVLRAFTFASPGTPLNPGSTSMDIDLVVYGVQ